MVMLFAAGLFALLAGGTRPDVCMAQEIAYHVTAARVAGDDARTRIVLEFDKKPNITVHYLADPIRAIVDIDGETAFDIAPGDLPPTGLFNLIRYGTMGPGRTRIVLNAARAIKLSTAEVIEDDKGIRLVLEGSVIPEENYAALVNDARWQPVITSRTGRGGRLGSDPQAQSKPFLVAVDAGHGGIDTGASSSDRKVIEKVVTLAFAKELEKAINELDGMEAFLTRDRDVFLSLGERVQIARQRGADLFISLHADSLRQKNIRGATVYTISEKASDSLAAGLAKRENISDEIAGVQFTGATEEVTDILIDLTRRETQTFSESLAADVVASFEGQITLINNPHRHAGFRVLQAPDVPSVLLELGFLSNKEDEKLLSSAEHQAKVAELIAQAADRYRKKIGG